MKNGHAIQLRTIKHQNDGQSIDCFIFLLSADGQWLVNRSKEDGSKLRSNKREEKWCFLWTEEEIRDVKNVHFVDRKRRFRHRLSLKRGMINECCMTWPKMCEMEEVDKNGELNLDNNSTFCFKSCLKAVTVKLIVFLL